MAMANLDDSADEFDTDVLIVGAGPAGLAAAIELGMRGVRSVLIEQQERTGVATRAKTTNVRTRTHMRRWGIADRLAEELGRPSCRERVFQYGKPSGVAETLK